MSIRKDAQSSQAFLQLKSFYDDRKKAAKEWKKQGKQVVGVMGFDVPDELLIAADMMPYRIFGQPDLKLTETDRYLEFSFPPAIRSQFEKILDGSDNDVMDHLIISNSTDALVRIYYYIREVKELEPEKGIPEIYFIDWLFTRYRMHQVRNEQIIVKFKNRLENWAGREITDDEIRKASEICNRNRQLLAKVGELRKTGKINGSEALVIIGAGFYMNKEDHSKLLEELLKDAEGWQETDDVKVFVTGSAQEHTDFYELLENMGVNVVSEDHDFGNRDWDKQTDMELAHIKAIVDRYMLRRAGTKRAFVSERVAAVCESVKECGAEGVISYTYMYDDSPSWDFPEEAKALKAINIPALQLVGQNYKVGQNGDAADKLQSFVSQIRKG